MKKKYLLLVAATAGLLSTGAFAQTARVQVIHNSADAAAATVDVYANGAMFIDDFEFRTAFGFADVPAGIPLTIDIAPGNSTSAAQSIASFPVTFTAGETYVVVANGIVSGTGYSPAPAFGLDVYTLGRESANVATNTDVLVMHGSTDAPTVDVVVPGVGPIVNDASYGDFAGYLEVAAADYTLNITDASGAVVVRSYQAPLSTLNLDGEALVVVASGFLNPANNSNGAAFGLWVALPSGGALVELPESNARLQVIHNSADAAAAQVDVYLDGSLLLDNFAFRTATPFIDLTAEVSHSIAIAPSTSTSVTQAIATFPVVLEANETYVVVANGIVSGTGYSPAPAFGLDVYDMGREAALVPANTDVLVVHGSTDAPTVDVFVPGAGTIVDDAAYGDFAGYLELNTADYTLNITDASGAVVVRSYQAPLSTLNLDGEALVVVASGFLNPANNSNGAAFGLWVALPSGGALVELPESNARLQVIHNSADAAAAQVDVYLDGSLLLDNFAFRTATPFIDLTAEVSHSIAIAPSTSTSVTQAIATFPVVLEANETYVVVANGIVSGTGYSPAPAFGLDIYQGARESAGNAANTDILVAHGSTDAPIVDVKAGSVTLVNDIAYGEFDGYLEVPTSNLTIDITDQSGSVVVASYAAPLQTLSLQGDAITVVASGFLNPANNSGGASFGLWVALSTGGALVPLGNVTSVEEENEVSQMEIFPNPANNNFQLGITILNESLVSVNIVDMQGRIVFAANHGVLSKGNHVISLDASELSAGTYVITVLANGSTKNLRLMVQH